MAVTRSSWRALVILAVIAGLLTLGKCEDPNPWSDPARRAVPAVEVTR